MLAKSWGNHFINPFSVTLLDSAGNLVGTKTFNDSRTFYLWEDVNLHARYIRLDSLNETPHYFILCSMEVFGTSYHSLWPPYSHLLVKTSKSGMSCKETCMREALVCEPAYFRALNSHTPLSREFHCKSFKKIITKYDI